jgi:hypothetical protein
MRNPSDDAVNFEAVKLSVTQDKNGYVLKLSIHPNDVPESLLRDWVGARYVVAMVRTGDDGSVIPNPEAEKARKIVTMAAMLCARQEFQIWLVNNGLADDISEDHAAAALRKHLNITSRADLKVNAGARDKFMRLVNEFETELR